MSLVELQHLTSPIIRHISETDETGLEQLLGSLISLSYIDIFDDRRPKDIVIDTLAETSVSLRPKLG